MSKLSVLWISALTLSAALLAATACAEPETVEVVKEVEVVRTVVVPGETVVKEVVKTVEVPGETVVKEVVKTVEVPGETVVKEVEVVKTVEVPGETVVKEVIKTVEVTPVPQPEAPASMGPPIYQMGIFEEPITRNFWNYFGGPGGSVWTQYVLGGHAGALYTYSDQRFDWIPALASDFPTALAKETVDGTEYWTTTVPMRTGINWSDGEEVNADDFVFNVNTALDMGLSANYASAINPTFLNRVEKVDSHAIKIYFNAMDEEGNELTPGLSVWQFGLGFLPILAEHYWAPVVEEAKMAGELEQQQEALFAHVPEGEPTIGGFMFSRWEPGAFYEKDTDPNYYDTGTTVTNYASGAYSESNPNTGHSATYFGEAAGDKTLEYTVGPHMDSALFSIYGNQDAAILALTEGDIDYVFNPLGLEKGFLERVNSAPDLNVAVNANNGVRYLGFNTRKAPMDIKEFRQAVATLIDKEFVASTILQGEALPVYSMVPEGNGFWHNGDVPKFGEGMSRGERIAAAVELLKGAGFTFEEEPAISEDGNFVATPGKGLKMPNGEPVPDMELIAPSAGYDPMRSTFAIWIERWLNDVGIPLRANLTGFNVIVSELFSDDVAEELDMWMLGWGLSIFPDYLDNFFHSRYAPENSAGGGYNWGGYANAEFDDLAQGLLSETTIAGAQEKAYQMQQYLADDLPYVTLFTTPKLDVYRPNRVEFPYTEVLGGVESQGGMQGVAVIK